MPFFLIVGYNGVVQGNVRVINVLVLWKIVILCVPLSNCGDSFCIPVYSQT